MLSIEVDNMAVDKVVSGQIIGMKTIYSKDLLRRKMSVYKVIEHV